MNEFDPTTPALLVNRYRQAEDLTDMGLLRRVELGAMLFELMNHVGETRLRGMVIGCCGISWDAATRGMHLALVAGPEFLEPSSWPNPLDSSIFTLINRCYAFVSYPRLVPVHRAFFKHEQNGEENNAGSTSATDRA